jgi:hypothetical protein
MAETGKAKVRGNSKPNVKRRGSTYTYYVYVTGPTGSVASTARAASRPSARPRTLASPPSTRSRRAPT